MNDELRRPSTTAASNALRLGLGGASQNEDVAVLEGVTITPKAPRYAKYRWCDYIELRCLTHVDHRFSRDALAEALNESKEVSADEFDTDPDEVAVVQGEGVSKVDAEFQAIQDEDDRDESFSATCFKHLRWRSTTFGTDWPFTIDEHAREISLKAALETPHYFYLHLLLSSTLKYCPISRRKAYTSAFEEISLSVFRDLMPRGAEVHAFGAAHSQRYTGHLFERLVKLATDVRGQLLLTQQDFPKNDAGDGGLDLVAWHDLKDTRDHIPISFAQCGCTAEDWPDKMLEASPTKFGKLRTGHVWATYYFMPLDLTDERAGQMKWQEARHVNGAIVIDRLRLIRLADSPDLDDCKLLARDAVNEAIRMRLT